MNGERHTTPQDASNEAGTGAVMPESMCDAVGPPVLPESFRDSAVAAFVIDLGHVVTHWNAACESATGIGADKMIGTGNHWQPYYVQQQKVLADFILTSTIGDMADVYLLNRFRSVPLVAGRTKSKIFSRIWVKAAAGFALPQRLCSMLTAALPARFRPCRM